jgi:hypothetical protein
VPSRRINTSAEDQPRSNLPAMVTSAPAVDHWSDYVHVDAVNGSELVVHTTRGAGHDTTPYRVIVAADTIVHPDPETTAAVVGSFEGVEPGDRFYLVGDNLHADSFFREVRAIRIFARWGT